ncbi:TetR/AcrR family transcriptional regulator [Tumebacillus permanentifrigoris]|uniref:TetR family transcriptional regulator n=1 Tax=Tumebacillus permanentifrigoris TaxID=378543 RepID=A0A316D2D4_9BACL|nr:TetR/AcrR family transcriptional regulator [Tumebacillus permanentifrigoris]PWK05034.1 TetR family transcriptional regulator [Tumebacillus permanentifrigoris]
MIAQKKNNEKYEAILNAAVKVIGQAGYHNAPISKIAREAGVADGTVYLYFKNKEDILISILRETIGTIVDRLDEELQGMDDPIASLKRLVTVYFETLGTNPDVAMFTQVHLRQSNAEMRKQIGEIIKPYYTIIDSVIAKGIAAQIFTERLDLRITRRMIFGTMDETITAWVLTGAKYDLLSLIPQVCDVMIGGLAGHSSQK